MNKKKERFVTEISMFNINFIKNLKVENLLIGILVVFYSVGIIGTSITSFQDFFLSLSTYNLLLSFFVALVALELKTPRVYLFIASCYVITMLAEWIGTSTGLLFGNYWYGNNLDPKMMGVPLIIGINWWLLVIGSHAISGFLNIKGFLKPIVSAVLMTLMDLIMEPVAIKSDFWHWKNEIIPLYNYFCWFVIAYILHLVLQSVDQAKPNKVHAVLFLIMAVFFVVLNLN